MDPIDRDFSRFAKDGNVQALGRVYDGTIEDLFALAMRLLGDAVDAEDAVQSAWVAAIEAAPSFDPARPVMPWLVGILTNRVRRIQTNRRNERVSRHRPPNHRSTAETSPSAEEPRALLESKELDSRITEALNKLPAEQRAVLVLRYRHGMEPAEIAFALKRPPGTVRSQLTRGLSNLRDRLPTHLMTPAFLAMALTSTALPALRATIMAKAASHTAVAAQALAPPTATFAIALMTKTTLIVAGVVLAATAGYLLWPTEPSELPSSNSTGESAAVAAGLAPTPAAATQGDAVAATNPGSAQRVSLTDSGAGRSLQVRVTHEGMPIANAVIALGASPYAQSPNAPPPALHEREFFGATCSTNEDGIARFEQLRAGSGIAQVLGARSRSSGARTYAQFRLKDNACVELELTVPPPAWIRGFVATKTGATIAGAEVWTAEYNRAGLQARPTATTTAQGTFEFPLWRGTVVGARADGMIPASREVSITPGTTHEIALHLAAGGSRLRGVVTSARTNSPISSVNLQIGDRFPTYHGVQRPDGTTDSIVPHQVRSDAEGRFELAGLTPGRLTIHGRRLGFGPGQVTVVLIAGKTHDVELELSPAASLHGRVRSKEGHRIRSGLVALVTNNPTPQSKVKLQTDGTFELHGLAPGTHRFMAEVQGYGACEATLELVAGESTEWIATLNPIHTGLSGRLMDQRGNPLVDWWVVVHAEDPRGTKSPLRTDAQGRFGWPKFHETSSRLRTLRVHQPDAGGSDGYPAGHAVQAFTNVELGTQERTFVVDATSIPSARVTGALRSEGGKRGNHYLVLLGPSGSRQILRRDPTGRFETDLLTPGAWALGVNASPRDHILKRIQLGPGENRDVGVITAPNTTAGTLRVQCELPPSLPERPMARLEIIDEETGGRVRGFKIKSGMNEFLIPPGSWLLRLVGAPVAAAAQRIEIAAGATMDLEFSPVPAVFVNLAFTHPGTDHAPGDLLVELLQAGSGAPQRVDLRSLEHRGRQWHTQVNLAPGTYTLMARTKSGLHTKETLVVGAAVTHLRPLVFALSSD